MDKKSYIKGLIFAGLAFIAWGLLPLYWKLVKAISPYQIFAHRVFWSLIFVWIILLMTGKFKAFRNNLNRKTLKANLLPAIFISINWLVYIWSVNNGYVIEASLGYYLNPLVLTLFGSLFFQERLTPIQGVGIAFALFGVMFKAISYGRIPYIALILAVSFAVYGLLKKKSKYTSMMGLGYETLMIGIPAFAFLIFKESSGGGISGNLSPNFWLLISLSGMLTAIPLLLYAEGTKRLPLTVVGFLQYIAPTIGLFLGIFVFKEPFEFKDFLPFTFIWVGLIFFSYSQISLLKNKKKVA